MKYVMKQKLWSFADSFAVKNELGEDVAQIEGKVLSWGDQLRILDVVGKELALIKQVVMSWGPTYEIYREGQLAAVVKKQLFTFMSCKFTVDVPGPDDLVAEGDLLDHEYFFLRGQRTVAQVSKQWFTWADTYGVELMPDEDAVLILASAVVIDLACHDGKDSR